MTHQTPVFYIIAKQSSCVKTVDRVALNSRYQHTKASLDPENHTHGNVTSSVWKDCYKLGCFKLCTLLPMNHHRSHAPALIGTLERTVQHSTLERESDTIVGIKII
jgi:hypothetical protein